MKEIEFNNKTIAVIDSQYLHQFILNKVHEELVNLIEPCYYPKVIAYYNMLLHMCKTEEKDLVQYGKQKYNRPQFQVLNQPYNILLVNIVQDFLSRKDLAGAEAAFHMLALKQYMNLLYKYTTKKGSNRKLCIPEIFQEALENISKNHLISKQKTISNMIIYLSREVFKRYIVALQKDDPDQIVAMIMALRTRLNQSVKSLFRQYYTIAANRSQNKVTEEKDYDQSHETKLKAFADKLARDICVYSSIRHTAIDKANQILRFNKRLSEGYIKELSTIHYKANVTMAFYLLMKPFKDLALIKSKEFANHVKQLMAIKVTKTPIYFKKTVSEIHDDIIKRLNLVDWYNKLTIQSKSLSRNFIAYYLAFYLQDAIS